MRALGHLAAALLCLWLAPAAAQTPDAPPAPSEAPAAAAADPLGALLDVLRDDAARAALIGELERLSRGASLPAAGPPAAPAERPSVVGALPAAANGRPAESEAPAAGDASGEAAAVGSVGRQLAELTDAVADYAERRSGAFARGLDITQRRLGQLVGARSGELVAAARSLALALATTVGVFLLLRAAMRAGIRRIGARVASGPFPARVLGWAGAVGLDVLTVLAAWGAGLAATYGYAASDAATQYNNTLYLNAFLVVQLIRAAIRAAFAPDAAALRPLTAGDAAARYWNGRLGGLVAVLGYGLLLVVPIVDRTVSIFTGQAVAVLVYALVLLWSMALVARHRKAPAAWIAARAVDGKDTTLRILALAARFWHWPALVWLCSLFITAVATSGNVGPMVLATAKAVGVLLVGAVLGVVMSRAARRGFRLPEDLKAQLPMLEERLNGFALRMLGAARLLLLVATVGLALRVSGLYDLSGWFSRRFGEDFGGVVVTVSVIVLIAFALWLALASWTDYRLNPDSPSPATARERTLLTLARNAGTIAIVILAVMFTMSELGLDIAPLLASAGVLGLAIGFGAQKMVQDIITGVFIQFENAINVGDVVTVAGVTGSVEKLTIRSVSLRTLDGTFHIIPFSSVDMVANFMRGFAFHVAEIGVAYREDIAEARRLMHAAFEDVKAMPEHGPFILGALDWHGVTAMGDNAVTLRARIRTRPGGQWAVGRAYTEAVKRRFDAAGVEIPFPQRTIWFGCDKDGKAPPVPMPAPLVRPAAAE